MNLRCPIDKIIIVPEERGDPNRQDAPGVTRVVSRPRSVQPPIRGRGFTHTENGIVWALLGVDGEHDQVIVEQGRGCMEREIDVLDGAIAALTRVRDHLGPSLESTPPEPNAR